MAPSSLSPQQTNSLELRRTSTILESFDPILDKLPSPIRTFLFDKYWKTPFVNIKKAADEEIAKTIELIQTAGKTLTRDEIKELNKFKDLSVLGVGPNISGKPELISCSVKHHHQAWLNHRQNRKPKLARIEVVEYKRAFDLLNVNRVVSHTFHLFALTGSEFP